MSSVETKDQILAAAGPIFARKGFAGATIREICQAAGVNLAAVNYYFGDKENLYLQTVMRARDLRSEQVPMPDWNASTPAPEMLRGFIMTMMRRLMGLDAAPWETQLMMREVLNPTEACKALVEEHFRPTLEQLLAILDRILPAEVPDVRRKKLAFSIFGQCLFYRVAGDVVSMVLPADELVSEFGVESIGRHIADITLAAIENCPAEWLEQLATEQ